MYDMSESNAYGVIINGFGVMSNGFGVISNGFSPPWAPSSSPPMHPSCECYSGVTVVLQWCYSGVTVVLQWCYSGVTVVLQCGRPSCEHRHSVTLCNTITVCL
jgi:hypothetical protein